MTIVNIELSQFSNETRKLMAVEATNEQLLDALAFDQQSNVEVQIAVAGNIHTGYKTLKKLSMSKIIAVRVAIAKNNSIDFNIFEKLVNDDNWEVRLAVNKNEIAKCTNIWEKLSTDTHPLVRQVAIEMQKGSHYYDVAWQ